MRRKLNKIVEFKTFNEMIEYLQDNFYSKDFINSHTRPDLIKILKKLFPNTNFTRSMCKKRQLEHIEFWLKLHNIRCKK